MRQIELLIRLRQRDGELVAVAVEGRTEEFDRSARRYARPDRRKVPRGARAGRRPDRSCDRRRSVCRAADEQRRQRSDERGEQHAARNRCLHVDPPGRAEHVRAIYPRLRGQHIDVPRELTDESVGLQGDDDLAARLSRLEVANRLGGFAQRVRAIDDRRHLAGLDELRQDDQVGLAVLREARTQALADEP